MYCTHCGKEIDNNAYVCPYCGVKVGDEVPLETNEKPRYCTHCGKQIPSRAYICVYCGSRVDHDEAPAKRSLGHGTVLAIVSLVCTLIMLTIGGALAAVIGMTFSIEQKDKKGIKANLMAFGICIIACIAALFI